MSTSTTGRGPLHLALEADGEGAHPAAGQGSGRLPGPGRVREQVAAAESAGFALVTFDDSPLPPAAAAARLEAGTRAAFTATTTDRIGLAPTLHTTVTEPFHLATQLASLDHASNGRGAWVVGAVNDAAAHATIGGGPLSGDALHREVADVIDVARALWDSWEDDAAIKDVATGRFLDWHKVHHVDFEGAAFTVKGPLITPRPPQGQLVVLAADSLDVAGRADVVLVARPDLAGISERAERARLDGAPLVFAEVEVVLDADESAAARLARLDEAHPWPVGNRLRHVGSAAALAALLRELAGTVDGVRLHPAELAVDLPVLAGQVLPALAADGLHRPPRPGDQLRTTLGLNRPANRFAATATTTS